MIINIILKGISMQNLIAKWAGNFFTVIDKESGDFFVHIYENGKKPFKLVDDDWKKTIDERFYGIIDQNRCKIIDYIDITGDEFKEERNLLILQDQERARNHLQKEMEKKNMNMI